MSARCGVLKVGGITVAIDGTKVLASASKHAAVSHQRAGEMMQELELEIEELLRKAEDADSTSGAPWAEQVAYRVATKAGRARYKLRQQTVEPIFGIIKAAMGFRAFRLRGLAGAATEWTLVTLAYNLRRLGAPLRAA